MFLYISYSYSSLKEIPATLYQECTCHSIACVWRVEDSFEDAHAIAYVWKVEEAVFTFPTGSWGQSSG